MEPPSDRQWRPIIPQGCYEPGIIPLYNPPYLFLARYTKRQLAGELILQRHDVYLVIGISLFASVPMFATMISLPNQHQLSGLTYVALASVFAPCVNIVGVTLAMPGLQVCNAHIPLFMCPGSALLCDWISSCGNGNHVFMTLYMLIMSLYPLGET